MLRMTRTDAVTLTPVQGIDRPAAARSEPRKAMDRVRGSRDWDGEQQERKKNEVRWVPERISGPIANGSRSGRNTAGRSLSIRQTDHRWPRGLRIAAATALPARLVGQSRIHRRNRLPELRRQHSRRAGPAQFGFRLFMPKLNLSIGLLAKSSRCEEFHRFNVTWTRIFHLQAVRRSSAVIPCLAASRGLRRRQSCRGRHSRSWIGGSSSSTPSRPPHIPSRYF